MTFTRDLHRQKKQFNNLTNKTNLASVSQNTKLEYQKIQESQELIETLITHNETIPLDNYVIGKSGVMVCGEKGGSIPSLVLDDTEIFYNDPDQRNDKNKPSREGFRMGPQAGPFTPEQNIEYGYNLSRHGFLRNVARKKENSKGNKVAYSFETDEETFKQFPHSFIVAQIIELGKKGAHITLKVHNDGGHMMKFAPGHHTYYKVAIDQKKDIQLSENMGISEEMKEKWISGEQTIKILNPGSCKISIPGTGLLQLDFDPKFKYIWFRSEKDKGFVCVEPVVCSPDERQESAIPILPGQKIEIGFTITLLSKDRSKENK